MSLDPHGMELVYSEEEIRAKVAEMASLIRSDYEGRDLVMVGILKGCFPFLADLARQAGLPCEIDFLWLSSYGRRRYSGGEIRVLKDLDATIAGRHVLVLEDIVDTGLTVQFLRNHLRLRNPESVSFATLVDKPAARMVEVRLEYVGFEAGEGFLVGYGMDDGEKHRNLPGIYRALE